MQHSLFGKDNGNKYLGGAKENRPPTLSVCFSPAWEQKNLSHVNMKQNKISDIRMEE
jgi:hypothetical protein